VSPRFSSFSAWWVCLIARHSALRHKARMRPTRPVVLPVPDSPLTRAMSMLAQNSTRAHRGSDLLLATSTSAADLRDIKQPEKIPTAFRPRRSSG